MRGRWERDNWARKLQATKRQNIQFLLCQFIHLFFHSLPSAHYSFFSLLLQSLDFLLSVSAGSQDILVHEGFYVHKSSSSQPRVSLNIRVIGGGEVVLKVSWQWHSSFPITMSSLRARISVMHFPASSTVLGICATHICGIKVMSCRKGRYLKDSESRGGCRLWCSNKEFRNHNHLRQQRFSFLTHTTHSLWILLYHHPHSWPQAGSYQEHCQLLCRKERCTANLVFAFKASAWKWLIIAAQISFAKANHLAIFIFKEQESAVALCAWEKSEKIWWSALMTTFFRKQNQELTCYVPTMY